MIFSLFNLSSLTCFGLGDRFQKDISIHAETTITMCLVNINTYTQYHHIPMNIKSDPLTATATCMNTLIYVYL
jgi:hypothetical protein